MGQRPQPGGVEGAADHAVATALGAVVRAGGARGAGSVEALHLDVADHAYRLRVRGQPDRLARVTRDRTLVDRERPALRALEGTGIALALERAQRLDPAGERWLALYAGRGALRPESAVDLDALAGVLAHLHDLPTLGLMRAFSVQDAPGVLAVLQRLVEQQRSYLVLREQDGLPQDMLALQLADLGRAVRRYAIAQEHHCQPHPRRALCHGAAEPARLLRDCDGLHLWGWEHARIGDAARDLALFAVAAGLDEEAEARLLERYLDARAHPDHRFLPRYFAHRALAVLERPVARLLRLYAIKRGELRVLDDPVTVLQGEAERATVELARALTTLTAFAGRGRPIAPRDVASMGRLITHEELLLGDGPLLLAVDGASYSGKTPTAALLAARLGAAYVNPAVLLRTALVLAGEAAATDDPAALIARLADRAVQLEALVQPPYYRVLVDAVDRTDEARQPALYPLARRALADPKGRLALRAYLAPRLERRAVVDGEQLLDLLPPAARRVVLACDDAVREQRRRSHVDDGAPDLPLEPALPPCAGATVVDSSRSQPAQTALAVIQALLPPAALEAILVPDFTGRHPLFER